MKKVSYTDFCEIRSLPGITASPDGKKAAFVVRRPDPEKEERLYPLKVQPFFISQLTTEDC